MTETATPRFVELPPRGMVYVEGEDRLGFLQNLLTNNLEALTNNNAVYACLLNAQGKFLHGMFVRRTGDAIALECEGGDRAKDLYKRLNIYRLRSKVKLSVEDAVPVYALLDGQTANGYTDPRLASLGWRTYEKPEDFDEAPFETWDKIRIEQCIPDGSRDLIPQKSTLSEGWVETLDAIDFAKGCYVGQELTARMHNRGLAKKHLYPARIFQSGSDDGGIVVDGKQAGEIRSRCGDTALVFLKDAMRQQVADSGILEFLPLPERLHSMAA